MLSEFLKAFFLVFAAELGDKSQIIAMTFATQYPIKKVIGGVALGVFLNHGIAVVLGRYISNFIPMDLLQLIAGGLFIVFGVLSLMDTDEDDEKKNKKNYGPILTVAVAFFIGEFGDKTQLTAMTLSLEGQYPLVILLGTITGMIATSSVGIFIGSKIGDRVPDIYIKIISSLVFVLFGSLKLYSQVPKEYLSLINISAFVFILILLEYVLIKRLIDNRKTEKSPIQKAAERLYIQNKVLSNAIDNICLGEDSCGNCQGLDCILGYTKYLVENARNNNEFYNQDLIANYNIDKNFDKAKVAQALGIILKDYDQNGFIGEEDFIVNKVRGYLELILFGKKIKSTNMEKYLSCVKELDGEVEEILEIAIKH